MSWLPDGFEHPLREDLPTGHHLRPIRGEDVDTSCSTGPSSRTVAGHPTLGTCHAWLEVGGVPKDPETIVQECDPVTGSLNAALAIWLTRTGRATPPHVAAQGTALGREGRVHVSQDDHGTLWVGGGTITCVAGSAVL